MSEIVKKANTNERIRLLSVESGTWDYHQVMKYFGWSRGKANDKIQWVENKNGKLNCYERGARRVRINDLLALYGTSREEELKINLLKQGGNNGN